MTNASKLITPLGNLSAPRPVSTPIPGSTIGNFSDIRFWREFAAGMKMFTLHLGRNNSDLNDVFHQNLSLLHNSLKTESLYQQFLQKLPFQASGHWNAIANSNEIHCGLANIVSSQNTSVNKLNQQIPNYYQNNETEPAHRVTNQGLLSLLVISGKLTVKNSLQSQDIKSRKNPLILKPGNTTMQSTDASSEIELLSHTASCQVLILAIPRYTTH